MLLYIVGLAALELDPLPFYYRNDHNIKIHGFFLILLILTARLYTYIQILFCFLLFTMLHSMEISSTCCVCAAHLLDFIHKVSANFCCFLLHLSTLQ